MAYYTFRKDPDAVLDYQIDWEAWLGSDTISASTWSVSGVIQDSATNTTTTTTVWLSGGAVGVDGSATNHITTAAGREEDRTITLSIAER